MTHNVRIGQVGTGYWGRNLLRNLDEIGALTAFCDIDPAARAAFQSQYPQATAYADFETLLQESDINGVMIATPAATHGKLVAMALDAGKHVFVEKPLCLDVAEAEALSARARDLKLTLMVGHLLLYHPAFLSIRGLVAPGRLGRLRYIYSNRLSVGKIRREENALWSFAPHDISMILALTGAMPEFVTATGGHYLSHDVADTTLSHLQFGDNVQAHIFVSWLHPFKDHKLVVVGEDGMVVFNDTLSGPEKVLLYAHDLRWEGDVPVVDRAEAEVIPYGDEEPLRRECLAFIDAVANGVEPPSNAAEGTRVLTVLDACQRALQSGQRIYLEES